jgi:CDGSH-type Zn-finger protein
MVVYEGANIGLVHYLWVSTPTSHSTRRIMKTLLLAICVTISFLSVQAQTTSIQVNPDGTHTIIHHSGNTAVQVNPDGLHSVVHFSGNTGVRVNPDGSHSTIHRNGNSTVVVNPDGTHTVILHNGSTGIQVNPDGTHTTIFHGQPGKSGVPPKNKRKKAKAL